jgi:hypothetical protein
MVSSGEIAREHVALVGECSIPVVEKVARHPFSSYRVSWRS